MKAYENSRLISGNAVLATNKGIGLLPCLKMKVKVQIMAGSAKLGPNDRQFKGVSGVERIEDADHYIYTVGSSTDYNEIYRLRKQLLDKFPESHIVAFKDGRKMDINEAIREFKAKR